MLFKLRLLLILRKSSLLYDLFVMLQQDDLLKSFQQPVFFLLVFSHLLVQIVQFRL